MMEEEEQSMYRNDWKMKVRKNLWSPDFVAQKKKSVLKIQCIFFPDENGYFKGKAT